MLTEQVMLAGGLMLAGASVVLAVLWALVYRARRRLLDGQLDSDYGKLADK